ncbi:winged helix-turn-helix domain-containing protein [Pseudoalteromonas denitrificans]|uniref:winged helix-turn-helix domain-containing protein n=1 Tax=Pseudoalteromonas denitrificans TaxID=43656 RepID=UPI0015A54952|nr:winged helix-turn-helix domain-containing protein [Pseudoalteromonas denitrificans]
MDPRLQTITDGDVKKELEPLLYKLLTYLILNRQGIVTREELVDEVWQQSYVDDNAINRAMSELRKVCKSDLQPGLVLKTHYRKGYSFLLDVQFVEYQEKDDINVSIDANDMELNTNHELVTNDKKLVGKQKKQPKNLFFFMVILLVTGLVFYAYYFITPKENTSINNINYVSDIFSWKKGTYEFPTLSPSGKYLGFAFKGVNSPVSNLHVKDMESLINYTIVESQYDVYPIGWSNKGHNLIYQLISIGDIELCEIWMVNLLAEPNKSKHKKLFECKSSYILSASSYKNKIIYTKYGYRGRLNTAALMTRDLSTGKEFQVSLPGQKALGDYFVKISKNFDKLVFLRFQHYGTQVFIANIDGSNQKMIADVNYIIRTASWDEASKNITWFNRTEKELNKYNIVTNNLDRFVINSKEEVNDLILDANDNLLITTKWSDYDLVNLELDTKQVSSFSNMILKERLVAPLAQHQDAILLVEGKKHAIWHVQASQRKKIIELDFLDTVAIAVSPNETQLLVARNNYLYFYSLGNNQLIHKVEIDGQIQTAAWGANNKTVIYTVSSSDLNKAYIWIYDINNQKYKQVSNSNVLDAKMISDTHIIYLDDQYQFILQNLEDNQIEEILDLGAEAEVVWTHDGDNLYYSDHVFIYRKKIHDKSPVEEVYKVNKDLEIITSLSSNQNSNSKTLYFSLMKNNPNSLIKMTKIKEQLF